MTELPCHADALVTHIAFARAQGRVVVADLTATLVPLLPSERRTFPEHVVRQIVRGTIFEKRFLHDLDALLELVDTIVMEGTHAVWIADGHHVYGGYNTIVRDDNIADLAAAAGRLRQLHVAIASVVDTVEALRDAETLYNP